MTDRDPAGRDPTARFSDRVADYVRYRPGYPDRVLDVLRRETGLEPGWVVADVGSGTGISAELFLRNGNVVHAVEPNREMREAAESLLGREPRFHSVDGRAEATGLPAASIDLAVAAQAFHWFDAEAARAEFARILRPGGWAALLWNTRRTDATPFLRAYEELLSVFGTDYGRVRHDRLPEARLAAFFRGGWERHALDNEQELDLEGLTGRLLSSSYVPGPDDPRRELMLAELGRIYRDFGEGKPVRVEYDTELHVGRVA